MCDNCESNNVLDQYPSIQPFCDQCDSEGVDCGNGSMDAACVYYHFNRTTPSKLTCLNIGNNTSLEQILETLDALVCNDMNVDLDVEDTKTIDLTATGPAKHHLKADVKISSDSGNNIEVRPDGLYSVLPEIPDNVDEKVSVDGNDEAGYLESKIIGGEGQDAEGNVQGWLKIDIDKVTGQLKVVPTIDFDALCELIATCKCSVGVLNLSVVFAAPCPGGYTLNEDETLCVSEETAVPTVSEDIVEACPAFYTEYSQYGAIVYKNGFKPNGTGLGSTLGGDLSLGNVVAITTPEVWRNNASGGDTIGPANRTGVWACDSIGTGSLGFSVPVNVPTTKKYYIAIAADDKFVLKINGTTVVDNQAVTPGTTYYLDGGALFRYWHIYPITLNAGVNYIDLLGVDTGGVRSVLSAEIYDNTLTELQAATLKTTFISNRATFPLDQNPYNNVNLIFSTRCARQAGSAFSVGNATCPDSSWSLDTTGGDPLVPPCQGINSDTGSWMCRRLITSAFPGYTATLVWDRLTSATEYQVQQKLASAPITSYIDSAGSPVPDPGTGSTVSLNIEDLSSNNMMFRVRPNYGSCYGPWIENS